MSQKKKIISAVTVAAAVSLLLQAGLLLFLSSGFDGAYEITTDTSRYREVITGEKWGMSEDIFPEDTKNLRVAEFKHVYYDPWDANYLAYLVIDYDREEYEKELERLHLLGIDEYTGYYGVTGFTRYELLAMEADAYQGFVYAMTDGEGRIIYAELIFCNDFMDIDYEEQMPEAYLPDGFNAKPDNPYQKSQK